MDFKQMVNEDITLFLNTQEFAETHIVDGRPMVMLIDNEAMTKRSKREFDGISIGDLMYYARTSDFIKVPQPERIQIIDGKPYTVFNVKEDGGITEVVLQRNRG